MPRLDRRIKKIAGIGGRMEVWRPRANLSPAAWVKGILDVGRWQVRHLVRTAEVTHSGSNGAVKRAIVARDFRFACGCPWNSRNYALNTPEGDMVWGFMEEILTGEVSEDYNVALRFFLGDPLSYRDDAGADLSNQRCLLYAPLALAEEMNTICDSTGTDVVRLDFRGAGNSLLQAYRGLTCKFGAALAVELPPS